MLNVYYRNRWNCEWQEQREVFQQLWHAFEWPEQATEHDHWIEGTGGHEIGHCVRLTEDGDQKTYE